MKLYTVKSIFKNNTFHTFVVLISLFIGSGMIASSLYRHYSKEPSETINKRYNSVKEDDHNRLSLQSLHAERG